MKLINEKVKKCPSCGKYMNCHIFGDRVYWICENCKNESITSIIAEAVAGHIK